MADATQTATWMNRKEVVEYLGKAATTIHRWRRDRGFPSHTSETGAVRYHRDEVDRWMQAQFPWFVPPHQQEIHHG